MTHMPSWIAGFVDGEGSFHIDIYRFSKMRHGYQIRVVFAITLHKDDIKALEKIRNFFGFGNITIQRSTSVQYRVTSFQDCVKIMKFFEKNRLQAKKYFDFLLWSDCIKKMQAKKHLRLDGIKEIEHIRNKLNSTEPSKRRTNISN